jgi:4-hydroxy 2-oxovalerate aldolase
MIRVATYIHQIPTAIDMVKDAHNKGYETTLNLMAVSTILDHELGEALEAMAQTEVKAIYLVDSWGVLYSEQIQELTRKYLKAVEGTGKEIGIHTHNNQQLAYANTVEALILGANWLDASICGIGRGAGNCPMELLIGFLRNPKFHLRPIIECIQNAFLPLRKKMEWGYDIPYMITGQLNQHPRTAMEFLDSAERENLVAFYDRSMEGV